MARVSLAEPRVVARRDGVWRALLTAPVAADRVDPDPKTPDEDARTCRDRRARLRGRAAESLDDQGKGRKAETGFALDQPVTTGFVGPDGPEVLTVDNGPGPGAIVYSSMPRPLPKPVPVPQPHPVPAPQPMPVPSPAPGPVPLPPGQSYPAPAPNPGPGIPMPTPAPGGAYGGGGGGLPIPSLPTLSPQQGASIAGAGAAALLLVGLLVFA